MFYKGKIVNPTNLQQFKYNLGKEVRSRLGDIRLYELSDTYEVVASFLVIQKQSVTAYVSYNQFHTFAGVGVAAGVGYDKTSLAIVNAIKNSITNAKKFNELESIENDIQFFAFRFLQDLSAGVNFSYVAKEFGYYFNQLL